jgi:hypothetical protein
MAFSEEVVKEAWDRANSQCECMKQNHSHFYRPCGKLLSWDERGNIGAKGWQAHFIRLGGGDDIANCQILCSNCYDRSSW